MSEQGAVDPRGPRAAAGLTCAVLALVLLSGSGVLLGLQALVLGLSTSGASPYEALVRRVLRDRTPPVRREPAAPYRTASLVGLVLCTVGALAPMVGAPAVGTAAVAAALAAAGLHAALGLCLGCELHLLVRRTVHRPSRTHTGEGATA